MWSRRNGEPASTGGKHICLSGIDGVGKSLQAGRLAKHIRDTGRFCYLQEAKEDFCLNVVGQIATRSGTRPREVLTSSELDIIKAFESLRDYAHTVLPIIGQGGFVVTPRSSYCRIALATAMGSTNVTRLTSVATFYGAPDLVVYLTAPVETCMERVEARGVDEEDLESMRKFKTTLDQMASDYGWPHVDATQDPRAVQLEVRRIVDTFLRGEPAPKSAAS